MRLLAELLLLPVTGPLRGLRFIAEQFQAELEAALVDESQVEAGLTNLSLLHDLGQISEDEYEVQETALLERLDAIRAYQEALALDAHDALDGLPEEEWDEL